MESSLFVAAGEGFLNLLSLKIFLAMLVGVSIGTFTRCCKTPQLTLSRLLLVSPRASFLCACCFFWG